MPINWQPEPPEGEREGKRYTDYFRRKGVTRESVLEAAELTYQRSNAYFQTVYEYFDITKKFEIACRKGCAFCCHTMVSVVPPEAFYLANYIETNFDPETVEAMKARVIAHDAEHRHKSGAARHVGRIACPMLDTETWLCSVHPARPLTCRSMHSGDVNPCRQAFEERDAYLPAPSHALFFKNTQAYYDAFAQALITRGLVVEPLELNAALAIIWTGEDVFDRWLSGEDVFEPALASHGLTDAPPKM